MQSFQEQIVRARDLACAAVFFCLACAASLNKKNPHTAHYVRSVFVSDYPAR